MSKQEFINLLLNCNGFKCVSEGSACELSCSVKKAVRNEDDETIIDASCAERIYESNLFRLHTQFIESVRKVAEWAYDVWVDGELFHFIIPQ